MHAEIVLTCKTFCLITPRLDHLKYEVASLLSIFSSQNNIKIEPNLPASKKKSRDS